MCRPISSIIDAEGNVYTTLGVPADEVRNDPHSHSSVADVFNIDRSECFAMEVDPATLRVHFDSIPTSGPMYPCTREQVIKAGAKAFDINWRAYGDDGRLANFVSKYHFSRAGNQAVDSALIQSLMMRFTCFYKAFDGYMMDEESDEAQAVWADYSAIHYGSSPKGQVELDTWRASFSALLGCSLEGREDVLSWEEAKAGVESYLDSIGVTDAEAEAVGVRAYVTEEPFATL